MFKSIRSFKKTVDIIPLMSFVLAAVMWKTTFYRYSLYLLLPTVIVYAFYKYRQEIKNSKYFFPYLLLIGWMILSSFFTPNTDKAMNKMIPVVATFLLSFSMVGLSVKSDNSKWLYWGYIALFFSIMYAVYISNGQILTDFDYANENEREAATLLDANQYAYFSMFAIMGFRLFLGDRPIKSLFFRVVIYIVMVGVSLYVALMTASRQVMLIQFPMIAYFVYFDFVRNKTTRNGVLPIIFLLFAFILIVPLVLPIYDASYLSFRTEKGVSEDTRLNLLLYGLKCGWENPIFGKGLGIRDTYSHCTYTHLFARCGLVACLLFLAIVIKTFNEQRRRYRVTHDETFKLYQFCVLVFFVANFFYSYINQPFMLTFLFLIVGDSNKRYHQYLNG